MLTYIFLIAATNLIGAWVWGIFYKYRWHVIQGALINAPLAWLFGCSSIYLIIEIFSGGSLLWLIALIPSVLMLAVCGLNSWRYFTHRDALEDSA